MDRNDHPEMNDALDSILDSLSADDAMEKKITEFSRNKQRSRRIQKARNESAVFQETYSSAKKEKAQEPEIVLDHNDYTGASASDQVGMTQPLHTISDLSNVASASHQNTYTGNGRQNGTAGSPVSDSRTPAAGIHGSGSQNVSGTSNPERTTAIRMDELQFRKNAASAAGSTGRDGADDVSSTIIHSTPLTGHPQKPVYPGFQDAHSQSGLNHEAGIPSDQLDQTIVQPVFTPGNSASHPGAGPVGTGTNPAGMGSGTGIHANSFAGASAGAGSVPGAGNTDSSIDHTMIHPGMTAYGPGADSDLNNPGGGTRVFTAEEMDPAQASGYGPAGAVYDDRLDSTIGYTPGSEYPQGYDDDEPMLKREFIDHSPKGSGKSFSWKIPAIIIGVVLIGVIALSSYQVVRSFFGSSMPQSEVSKTSFDKLLKWAQGYDSLSEADQKEITEFEKIYNKLSESQKSEIDKILTNLTGKNFNELLAMAKSDEKADKDNNNTEIAEKKAEIKDQIAELQNQINGIAATMNGNQKEIDAALKNLNDKQAAAQKAQSDYDAAAGAVNELNTRIETLKAEETSLNNQISQATKEIGELEAAQNVPVVQDDPGTAQKDKNNHNKEKDGDNDDDHDHDDENQGPTEIPTPQPPVTPPVDNSAKIAELQAQIDGWKNDLNTNAADQKAAASDLAGATSSMKSAEESLNQANQAVAKAQEAYDAVKGKNDGLQTQVDGLQAQIDELNAELESLEA